jgi:hypothetical protein
MAILCSLVKALKDIKVLFFAELSNCQNSNAALYVTLVFPDVMNMLTKSCHVHNTWAHAEKHAYLPKTHTMSVRAPIQTGSMQSVYSSSHLSSNYFASGTARHMRNTWRVRVFLIYGLQGLFLSVVTLSPPLAPHEFNYLVTFALPHSLHFHTLQLYRSRTPPTLHPLYLRLHFLHFHSASFFLTLLFLTSPLSLFVSRDDSAF